MRRAVPAVPAWLLTCLWILSTPGAALSQGPYIRFERLLPETGGAPVPGISSVLQDGEGYIWFGTIAGLARYDGYRFRFHAPSAEPGSVSPPEAMIVYPSLEDSRGDIWIGTNGRGLFRFDKGGTAFVQFRHDPANPNSLSGDTVLALQEDRTKKRNLWVGTRLDGLCRFDRATETFRRVPLDDGAGAVWDLLVDGRGFLWAGTADGGLYKINPEDGGIVNFRFSPADPRSLGSDTVWTIFEDGQGTLWVGTKGGGLNRYVPEDGAFVRFTGDGAHPRDLISPPITAIAEDAAGRIWIGTAWDGIRIWDRASGAYVVVKHDPQDPESLSDDNITCLLRDASGLMWAGTARGGINKSSAGRVKFAHFKHSRYDPSSLSRNEVRALSDGGSGRLWVGFDEGLDEVDGRAGVVRRFRNDPSDRASLSPGGVLAVCGDGAGRVWIGLDEHGLDSLDPRTGRFEHHPSDPADPATISNNRVYAIRPDGADPAALWVGTHQGLNRLDTRTGRFTRFLHDDADAASLSSSIITAILPGRSGSLWIGTRWGLNRMDKTTGRCERYVGDIRAPAGSGPSDNIINCLHEDGAGILWLGTNNGLDRFDPSSGTWSHILPKDGLPGGVVCGILGDDSGLLWLSTNRGLARFDPRTRTFTHFGRQDGVQADEFFPGVCLKDAEGRLALGGVNGFNVFRPAEVRGNPFVPPVAWTAFYRNGQDVKIEDRISRPEPLKLVSGSDVYVFEFAALCFSNPPLNRFAYKLEPRDRDWIDQGTRRTVTLSRLKPGEYRLLVKGGNPDGAWSENALAIGLRISAPLWRRTWFLVLALMFLASGIAIVVRMWLKLKSAFMVVGDRADRVIESYDLTAREREILRLILQGASNKDIAGKLFVSASTVRNHIYNIYQKLHVGNRLELINLIGKDARNKA